MIIILKQGADMHDINDLREWIRSNDLEIHYSQGQSTSLMGLVGDTSEIDIDMIKTLPCVEKAIRIQEPYKFASIKAKKEKTIVDVAGVKIGDGKLKIIAGPCSVENQYQIEETAMAVRELGADMLRGGAFKPRTSPYSFQGLREEGIKLLTDAKRKSKLPLVSEISDIAHLSLFNEVDLIQVGTRNMQNFELLKELGRQEKPVLLKRGLAATLDEFLLSAEYILSQGNPNVILCERGVRACDGGSILDISAIAYLKKKTHLPIIVDPSHASGDSDIVPSLTLASIVAGADGVMIEVHQNPQNALCDGPQALDIEGFADLMKKVDKVVKLDIWQD